MPVLAKLLIAASMALPLLAQAVSEEVVSHVHTAQEAERRNDFATAVHEYEYVVRLLPRSAEMQSNLGVALYFNHELPHAITAFRRAIGLNPDLLAPHLFSGLALYRVSNPDAAVPELEQAVRINSSDVIAHIWLGYAYTAQSRSEPALKEFQAACKIDPNNIDVWYALGQTYLQIGKDATLQLLAIAPDGGRTWQLAGEQAQLRGNRQEAFEDFKGALERRPDISELRSLVTETGAVIAAPSSFRSGSDREDDLYRLAHQAERDAHAAFEHVAKIAPDSFRAHQIMADSLAAEQRPGEAIQEYRIVLKLNPDLPGIHEAIGNILEQTGKPAEALREYESELQIQPRSAKAHTNVARALLLTGNHEEAAKMLTAALQMDRPPPEVYRLLGKLDLRRANYRSAANLLTRYVSIRTDDSAAYYSLAMAYRGLGDKQQMDRALGLYKKVSKDAKARSRAQRELQSASEDKQEPEDVADEKQSAAH